MSTPAPEPDDVPPGVTLRDPEDHATLRKNIFDGVKDEFIKQWPQKYGNLRMEVEGVDYEDPEEYTLADQKDALLHDKFLSRRLRGTVHLWDDNTGQKLESKKLTLMRVPYLTERGTFVHGGNDYSSIMQARLIPGPYARRQNNGVVETHFNVRSGSGNQFRVALQPETAQYRLRVQQADLHLYSLLHDLGVPDEHLEKSWGSDILAANKSKYDSRVFDKAYARFVPKKEQKVDDDRSVKVAALRKSFDDMKVHQRVMRKHLPNYFDLTKSAEWSARMAATKMAAEVEKKTNDRVAFKPDYTPDELTKEYNAMYAGVGPRLAGMDKWPSHWFPPGSDELGWLNWYKGYHEGKRTDDDERQIGRWKSFKRRHGGLFSRNPSARRAFSLRNWAIDPMKLLANNEDQDRISKEMDEYKATKDRLHSIKKASMSMPDMQALAQFLNEKFQAGIDLQGSSRDIADAIMQFVENQGVNPDILSASVSGLQDVQDQEHQDFPLSYQAPGPDSVKAASAHELRDRIAELSRWEVEEQPEFVTDLYRDAEWQVKLATMPGDDAPSRVLVSIADEEYVRELTIPLKSASSAGFVVADQAEREAAVKYASEVARTLVETAAGYAAQERELLLPNAQEAVEAFRKAASDMGEFTHTVQVYSPVLAKSASLFGTASDEDEMTEEEKRKQQRKEFMAGVGGAGLMAGGFALTQAAGMAIPFPGDKQKLTGMAGEFRGNPSAPSSEFDYLNQYDRYISQGHRAMQTQIYNANMLHAMRSFRKLYGAVIPMPDPNGDWRWKDEQKPIPDIIRKDLNPYDPTIRAFSQMDDKGNIKTMSDSAQHYTAFKQSPLTAYKRLWVEAQPDKAEHLSKLLDNWKKTVPESAWKHGDFMHPFDQYVKTHDPLFYRTKYDEETRRSHGLQQAGIRYADTADAVLNVFDRAPRMLGYAAMGIGATGLGLWLHRKYKQHMLDQRLKKLKEEREVEAEQ